MVTNALSPMRVIEALHDLVAPDGTIAVMSSGQGSIANNERGGFKIYRGTKAALNMFMRSYAARHHNDPRTLLLMAPGWVKTRLGGPNARLTIDESIPNLVNVIDVQHGLRWASIPRLSPGRRRRLVNNSSTPGRPGPTATTGGRSGTNRCPGR